MMCFSDFPMPDDYPNFMHNSQLLQYFRLYAERFDLLQHIHFQVLCVSLFSFILKVEDLYTNAYFSLHTLDHCEEYYTKARLLSVWSVGCSDHKPK